MLKRTLPARMLQPALCVFCALSITSCDDSRVTPIEQEGSRIDPTQYLGCYATNEGEPIFLLEFKEITNLSDNSKVPVMDFRAIKQRDLVFLPFEVRFDPTDRVLRKGREIPGFRYEMASDGEGSEIDIPTVSGRIEKFEKVDCISF